LVLTQAYQIANFYGVALAALGMLGTLATALTIDAYGPISDNAGGIAEMAGMGDDVRERTDALDAAGNTTAAIGKVSVRCETLSLSGQPAGRSSALCVP